MIPREQPGPILNGLPTNLPDTDPEETREWQDSLDGMIDADGRNRARYVMLKLNEQADEFLDYCPTWVSIRNDHHRGLLLIERYHPGMQDIVNRLDREAGIRHPADKETEN